MSTEYLTSVNNRDIKSDVDLKKNHIYSYEEVEKKKVDMLH